VAGNEDVTTPAGTFKTVKIVIDFNGRTSSSSTSTPPSWRVLTYWYAPQAKRVVKTTARTRSGVTNEPDYDVELISYKLN
jgi:hypothetical protein